ncbi:apoptosis-stimulating of p53 protein 1 [Sarotherodon galilaeus]
MGSDVTWLNESNYLVSVAEVQHTMAEKPLTDWDSGLLDCFEDASTCCYGFWCGPCLACTVAGRFGENSCLPLCDTCCFITSRYFCVPIFPLPAVLSVRAAMRNRYGIKGSLCKDIAISSCCCTCSWCQMHRELKHRKQAPTVVNIQNNNIVNMQPVPVMQAPMMMMPSQPVPAAYMAQPAVTVVSQ